ncbi:DUF6731 family protein [Campylobacter concisus]|uniref:DUF6731 family protein n=1 Tax=Campylobacter concisus TaxID=199 RepID=UPI000D64331C|nr:DUF6731 family protein [Campylobacter concisus]DAX97036.1 MAG TPA: protein of unknown function (DUF4747) [Caudoviricetes sp.]
MDIKFYFYKVVGDIDKNLFGYSLEKYFSNGLSLQDGLIAINENKGFLDSVNGEKNIFIFQKFRKDFNPIIKDEVTGKTREIKLNETEYIIEQNYLFWDFENNIIIYQKTAGGFNTTAFETYIKELLKEKFKDDFFTLKPIISHNGYEKIINSNIIKAYDIALASPSIKVLQELGLDDKGILKIDDDNLGKVEIKITAKKGRGLFGVDTFKSLLGNKENYSKMRIKTSNSYLKSGVLIDLLDEFYTVSRSVRENKKRVAPEDMLVVIKDVYEKHIQEIMDLSR